MHMEEIENLRDALVVKPSEINGGTTGGIFKEEGLPMMTFGLCSDFNKRTLHSDIY